MGRWKCGNVKKLKMTEPFLGNGSLILDDGISGTRADSMDPGGSGDFGFGPSGVVRGQNRSTKRADQTESPSLSARLCLSTDPRGKKGGYRKMRQPCQGAVLQRFAHGLDGAWRLDGLDGAEQSPGDGDERVCCPGFCGHAKRDVPERGGVEAFGRDGSNLVAA